MFNTSSKFQAMASKRAEHTNDFWYPNSADHIMYTSSFSKPSRRRNIFEHFGKRGRRAHLHRIELPPPPARLVAHGRASNLELVDLAHVAHLFDGAFRNKTVHCHLYDISVWMKAGSNDKASGFNHMIVKHA